MINNERLRALGLGHIWNVQTGDVAPGTTGVTTTSPLSIYNPPDSRMELVLMLAGIGMAASGTLGAGHVVVGYANQGTVAPTGGTDLTNAIRNCRIGAPAPATSVAKAYQGATIVSPTPLRPICPIGAGSQIPDSQDCLISILPGWLLCFGAVAAAGSTPLVRFFAGWGEYKVG